MAIVTESVAASTKADLSGLYPLSQTKTFSFNLGQFPIEMQIGQPGDGTGWISVDNVVVWEGPDNLLGVAKWAVEQTCERIGLRKA